MHAPRTAATYSLSLHDALPISLGFAQGLGLTHRDIKPGNILHKDGTDIKIADFGAAINKVSDRTVITNVGSDRKSTRLNSSHSSISYAVFCMKNKKQITETARR